MTTFCLLFEYQQSRGFQFPPLYILMIIIFIAQKILKIFFQVIQSKVENITEIGDQKIFYPHARYYSPNLLIISLQLDKNQFILQLKSKMESQLSTTTTYSLYDLQVSGKAPKLVTADNKIILKCYINLQYQFYTIVNNYHVGDPGFSLKYYLPLFKGEVNLGRKPEIHYNVEGKNKQISIWLQHLKMRYDKKNESNKFLLMENFLHNYAKPNILDIKIGGRQQKPNKITKSVSQFKIKLNGMVKTNRRDQKQFISKYILNQIQDYIQIKNYFAYFFNNSGKLNPGQLENLVEKLKELIIQIRSMRGWKFVSTSICIFFDAERDQSVEVKFIDFGRATFCELVQNYDEDTSVGIENIIKIIKQIVQNKNDFEYIQVQKNGQVVPPSKVKKFQAQQQKSECESSKNI